MVYVKPTVHLSRFAGSALKSFTHGYAQTVVAASQSSYASQNTPVGPLANNLLLSRFGKSGKSNLQNVYQQAESARHSSTGASAGRPETSQNDSGLAQYYDAWQSHQRTEAKEWQQFQFTKRIEWQPPTTVPASTEAAVFEEVEEVSAAPARGNLKRSYTTSAVENFGKAIDDEAAEALALAQVNEAIAEEIQRSRDEAEMLASPHAAPEAVVSREASSFASDSQPLSSPATSFSGSASETDAFTEQLSTLAESKQYGQIPAVFESMLRAGVQKPSAAAYRALLTAAIELTTGSHQKVPKALEVYSDMLRRKITPDMPTYGILIDLLARRSLDVTSSRKALEERLVRYGGLEEPGKFMFRSSESEHAMLTADNALSIALKAFDRASNLRTTATLPSEAYASLIAACAEQGRVVEMTQLQEHMESRSVEPQTSIYPPMIAAFGSSGDLRNAVEVYDEYRDLAIAHNAGSNAIVRNDNEVYAAVIKAYGSSDRLKGGLHFLSKIQSEILDTAEIADLRETVALQALLPLALHDETFRSAFDLVQSLHGRALPLALQNICTSAADKNLLEVSLKAYNALAQESSDLAQAATAMLAMHVRNANVEAAEPFWRVLESSPANVASIEPATMRTVALIGVGQAERGLRHTRRMFARIRDAQSESKQTRLEVAEQIDEAVEVIGNFMLRSNAPSTSEASVDLLRMMIENGGLVSPIADHVVARLGPEQISRLPSADIELLTRIQASMVLDEAAADIAGPARFGCLLENLVSRSILPDVQTENLIEKTLVNVNRADLTTLWNNYRYPSTPTFTPAPFTPVVPFQQPAFISAQPTFDDSSDPYAARTDVKGSNAINELLERPQGRRLNEALAKFRNMRRAGRHPRMFTYGKLIEGAAKENNLNTAHEILETAKQDVPFTAQYRVVRHGWVQILDHMVAGCLNAGRRDLAAKYHHDLLEMGAAPSANTFGLYITTLKDNTKTFDEATEAVKIFLRAKAEGVEPSSFLYNALIGKLGKARRIDDCLFYFAEMRNLGIRPTSVTYGTIVNALTRVSDEKFAEEIFEEMESCANYKPRPAPYHSVMQFFLGTKRDRSKVLSYYERMCSKGIQPTAHTYKLLIDTHATLEPVNMAAAEAVVEDMQKAGEQPEAVHYAALIHAKGCVLHDTDGARALFDSVIGEGRIRPQPCMYQALFESLNANHRVVESDALLHDMVQRHVDMTPYIANALIHGWTLEKDLSKSKEAFARISFGRREPSTYEAMVRAHLAVEDREGARSVVREALGRGYPSAVAGKIAELVGGGKN